MDRTSSFLNDHCIVTSTIYTIREVSPVAWDRQNRYGSHRWEILEDMFFQLDRGVWDPHMGKFCSWNWGNRSSPALYVRKDLVRYMLTWLTANSASGSQIKKSASYPIWSLPLRSCRPACLAVLTLVENFEEDHHIDTRRRALWSNLFNRVLPFYTKTLFGGESSWICLWPSEK